MEVQRAQLTKAFKTFDADSTGFLNEVELRNLMCGMVSCIPLSWFVLCSRTLSFNSPPSGALMSIGPEQA